VCQVFMNFELSDPSILRFTKHQLNKFFGFIISFLDQGRRALSNSTANK